MSPNNGQFLSTVNRRNARRGRNSVKPPPEGGPPGAALALHQMAQERCPHLPPTEAADLWAVSVYARRIMRAWGLRIRRDDIDLAWLRHRAAVEMEEPRR